jgi:exonuclease III
MQIKIRHNLRTIGLFIQVIRCKIIMAISKHNNFPGTNVLTVTGVMRSALYIDQLLNDYHTDILALSEHWLFSDNLIFLDSINKNYKSLGVADLSLDVLDPYRRGKGGVALMWKKSLKATPIALDDDRIIGIKVYISSHRTISIFAVYLPSTNQLLQTFSDYIDRLDELYHQHSMHSDVLFLGDCNVQINGPKVATNNFHTNPRTLIIQKLLESANLVSVVVQSSCSGPNYTYDPYLSGTHRSLIDHVILKKTMLDLVRSSTIIDRVDSNVSDHLPVLVAIEVGLLKQRAEFPPKSYLNWRKCSEVFIRENYTHLVQSNLDSLFEGKILSDIVNECDIETVYNKVVHIMQTSAVKSIPTSKYAPHLKPFWKTSGIKNLHNDTGIKRHIWVLDGRPRGHQFSSFKEYKDAKRKFRCKMRQLTRNYEMESWMEIEDAAELDQRKFWSLIRCKRSKSHPGVELDTGNAICRSTAEMLHAWSEHFTTLYTPADGGQNTLRHCTRLLTVRVLIKIIM